MKYKKTFADALKEVREDFDDINRQRRQGGSRHVAMNKDDPKNEQDKIRGLENQIQMLKIELENEKNKTVKPEPNKDTGEVPLRTGVAQAILDKTTPMPFSVGTRCTKISLTNSTFLNVIIFFL